MKKLKEQEEKFTREDIVFLTNMAFNTGRYTEMLEYTKMFSQKVTELTLEERSLFSMSFKQEITNKRSELQKLEEIDSKENIKKKTKIKKFVVATKRV